MRRPTRSDRRARRTRVRELRENLPIPSANRTLLLVGLFFLVNGVHVAFFSANLLTSIGYYAAILLLTAAATAVVLSQRRPTRTRGRARGRTSISDRGRAVDAIRPRLRKLVAAVRPDGGGMDRL